MQVEEHAEDTLSREEPSGESFAPLIGNQNLSQQRKLPFFKRFLQSYGLFTAALCVYLFVRLYALPQFPIYFFTDEAIQTVKAADLLRDDLHDERGEWLPTYFENGSQYNLSVSVYLQVLPTMIFGKQIWVTRGVSVLISLLAALGVGLLIQHVFKQPWGWLAVLLLSLMPAWFLHSRTAFETSLAFSFYAAFLFCFASYRNRDVRWLYPAAVFAALTFYSYSPGQMVIAVTLVGVLLSDFQYHWKNRKTIAATLLLGLVLLIPYIRFQINHPGENFQHLVILNSYLVQDTSLTDKVGTYFQSYRQSLNPLYWFLPNNRDIPRHLMKGYAHLWRPAFVFVLIGLYAALQHIRDNRYRLVLISLLAAPSGAALVELGITRALFMVIPASLLATLGLLQTINWAKGFWQSQLKRNFLKPVTISLLFLFLSGSNIAMLNDALTNGPLWYTDYGMFAMQYGARQVFPAIAEYIQDHPKTDIMLSPNWANGTDIVARFFFPDPLPFQFGSIDFYINEYHPFRQDQLLIMLPEELEQMEESGKFQDFTIEKTIPYPNGEPGFYFARMRYVDNIEEVFAKELAVRRTPIQEDLILQNGETAVVQYSPLDMGKIVDVFDGDDYTLARTWEANPFQILVEFMEPQPVNAVELRVGGEHTRIEIVLWDENNENPQTLDQELPENPDPRKTILPLPASMNVSRVEIYVKNIDNDEPAHVHLWEVQFLP